MSQTTIAAVFAGGLFIAMLFSLETGRRIGKRQLAGGKERARGAAAMEGSIFALLGLLIAFTFSGAATRFDQRREAIIQEVNAIGTAWLRLDLLPEEARQTLRELFRRYLDDRLAAYAKLPDLDAARAELAKANAIQAQIWAAAVKAASENTKQPLTIFLLPALNQMFDIAQQRTLLAQIHPPPVIFGMLGGLALVAALIAGYGMAESQRGSWIYSLSFALILAASVYLILDLEYPRLGWIRVDAFDQALVSLRQSMK